MENKDLLHLIGLAKKAGRAEIGEEPVGVLCRQHDARLILLAADAAPSTRRRCLHFAEEGDCLWIEVPFTKEELGRCLGRTSCAIAALSDIGFAGAIAGKLAATDPERYGETAERLALKAKRAAERRKAAQQETKDPPAKKPAAKKAAKPPAREPAAGKGPGGRKPYGGKSRSSEGAGSEKPVRSKTGGGRKAYGGKPRGKGAGAGNPYRDSRPVKHGKGSFRKKEGS